ncbi:spore cortex-lytic enzyme [Desulfotomaculum defluvii]
MQWRNKKRILIWLLTVLFICSIAGYAFAQNEVLYWGSSGTKVRAVQQKLKDWGYYDGAVDGYYSGKTASAVRKFQAYHGLRADGIVGSKTFSALGINTPPPKTTYKVSSTGSIAYVGNDHNVNLLARVIMGEAADEPYIGKVAVGAVILNRTKHSGFPQTLAGVVYQPLAFESVSNGQYNRPLSSEAVRAAHDALAGYDPTGGATFFWNPYKPVSRWIWSRRIVTQIGNHVFGY